MLLIVKGCSLDLKKVLCFWILYNSLKDLLTSSKCETGERRSKQTFLNLGSIVMCVLCWEANVQCVECMSVWIDPFKDGCVPILCNQGFDVFCCEALVRLWGEGVMIDLKKKEATLRPDPWQPSYFRQGSWVNNARAIFPLVFNLALFLQRKFLLAF